MIREEISASTARLIANPVAHKLKAAAIDDVVARIRSGGPVVGEAIRGGG